jgi:hypothetical protein
VQLEGMLDVEERLGAEEQEHIAAGSRDAPRQTARPATRNKGVRGRPLCSAASSVARICHKAKIISWNLDFQG